MPWRHLGLILLISPVLALAAIGLLLGPPGALVILPIMAAVFAYVVVCGFGGAPAAPDSAAPLTTTGSDSDDRSPFGPGPGWLRRPARVSFIAAVVTAVMVLVVIGLVGVAGPATPPVLLLLIVAAVGWVWLRLRPHVAQLVAAGGDRPTVGAGAGLDRAPSEAGVGGREVGALSTRVLCAAWQRSHFELRHAPGDWARNEVAGRRPRYLDELVLKFCEMGQVTALKIIWDREALNYYHCSPDLRESIDTTRLQRVVGATIHFDG